jgi:hypothetical protein
MAKIDINKAAEILKKNHLEPGVMRRIIEEMNLAAQATPGPGDEPEPHTKKQYVILLSKPVKPRPTVAELEKILADKDAEEEQVGWVLQIPEDESPVSVRGRIFKAAYDYNASKKGRLFPAKTVAETLEAVPARFAKEADLWVKTKEPIQVIVTDNLIPKDISE